MYELICKECEQRITKICICVFLHFYLIHKLNFYYFSTFHFGKLVCNQENLFAKKLYFI